MPDRYEPILPEGHDLAPSRKNKGVMSGNTLNDAGNLGRADWRLVSDGKEFSLDEIIAIVIGTAAATAGVVIAAPQIKRLFQERVLPRLKRRHDESAPESSIEEPTEDVSRPRLSR